MPLHQLAVSSGRRSREKAGTRTQRARTGAAGELLDWTTRTAARCMLGVLGASHVVVGRAPRGPLLRAGLLHRPRRWC